MTEALSLTLHDISKTFHTDVLKKPFKALREVTCTFEAGKCTGLLGHNGAGKTTTIRMILGLIRQDKGDVKLGGRKLSIQDRSKIGFVPEVNKLAVNLTCAETLDLHSRLFLNISSAERKKRVHQLLEKVGLGPFVKKRIKHLSKGMARRLAWAQAVIHEPRLLILDEPFSGLDPLGRRDMNQWIAEQKNKGVTIILCTHDMWTIESLCDEINILNKGQLVFSSLLDGSARNTTEAESYDVEVAGASEASMRDLMKKFHFDTLGKISNDGFVSKVEFRRYQDAGLFLQTCVSSGLIVNKFAQAPKWNAERILEFFDRDTRG